MQTNQPKFNFLITSNNVRRDSLLRLSDSAETLRAYLSKYYKTNVTPEQAEKLFFVAQAAQEKVMAQRKAERELVTA